MTELETLAHLKIVAKAGSLTKADQVWLVEKLEEAKRDNDAVCGVLRELTEVLKRATRR